MTRCPLCGQWVYARMDGYHLSVCPKLDTPYAEGGVLPKQPARTPMSSQRRVRYTLLAMAMAYLILGFLMFAWFIEQ